MEPTHRHCRNFAPVDASKGLCHRAKELLGADDPTCEDHDPLPRCASCRHYAPSERPFLGFCEVGVGRPMTYPDLVAVSCADYAAQGD